MTEAKTFKRRVRARMTKTGESYTTARTQLVAKKAARARLAADDDRPADAVIQRSTGKSWDQWFALLDTWGAKKKPHTDIARHVRTEYGVDGWWSQAVTVYYERSRGLRVKYQRPDGFSITASKTIAVPVDVLFDAFVDDVTRKSWLVDASMSLRTAQTNRSARFDWEDGSTRVNVGFTDKGDRSNVALSHERLADADEAEGFKQMWKERLADLKAYLEK
jgi:uncharacterized protein YndB with AHSA1/START domain